MRSSLGALSFPLSLITNWLIVYTAQSNKAFYSLFVMSPDSGADARAPAVVLLHQVNTLLCFSFLIGKVG